MDWGCPVFSSWDALATDVVALVGILEDYLYDDDDLLDDEDALAECSFNSINSSNSFIKKIGYLDVNNAKCTTSSKDSGSSKRKKRCTVLIVPFESFLIQEVGSRGTKRKNFAEELNFFSSSNGIKILAICDTKSTSKPEPHLLNIFGFNNCDFIPSVGLSGAQPAEKPEFWNEFQNFILSLDLPFLLLGDLNEIKSPTEKEGGAKISLFLEIFSLGDKKKTGSENVFEILDRAIASSNWMSFYPNMEFIHHAFTSSDHCPISVKFHNQNLVYKKAPPFRFELVWTLRNDFSKMVKSCWQYQFQGSYMYCLSQKYKFLKQKAKKWNESTFGNIFRQLSIAEKKLENIQNQLGTSHIADLENAQLRWLKKRDALLDYKRVYWQQKTRINKANFGDNNTKFFQSYATIRRSRNGIKQFFNKNGACITDKDLIKQEISDEFKIRFTKNQSCIFDKDEDFKSIKGLISTEDNNFLTSKLLKEVNHTFIALIPKIDNPQTANHFRPISLCSTVYKIISKIIATRLRSVLHKIIHPFQGAFTPNHFIQDNILLAHEIFNSFKRKKGKAGWIAIKLDMEKAYDRLEWNFIEETFKQMGFNHKWISWIMECIKTTSFSVLVNGTPGDVFRPTRGIRQGDPLSPYIFIMCAELLARSLKNNSDMSSTDIGIRIGPGMGKIPFLTFADDTIIFAKATKQSCKTIKSILDKFCTISGQSVNFNKSTFQCTKNIDRSLRESFRGILQMNEEAHLGKYLGCPIIDNRVTKNTFENIVQSSCTQLSKWKANSLSQAGRLVLVNANLASKGTF
ncbi:uncharacterized protein LOC141648697 [Silene latifolia]|uniref:uncharacterized protein LOC141648697 n=1 Tax=Silene latifolia TaxID=37657 RepID=UPI003D7872F7